MIKGIAFDLDGVYFKSGKEEFIERLSKRFGVEKASIEELFSSSEMMSRYVKGEVEGRDFWAYAMNHLGIKSAMDELMHMLADSYEVYQKSRELMEKLRSEGYKIIACSNNYRERVESLNARFGFMKDFDFCIFSYEHHMFKPELFRIVAEKTNLAPEEILVLDDNDAILEELRKMGFETIHCEESCVIEKELSKKLQTDR